MKKIINCFIIDDDKDDQEIFLMCVEEVSKNVDCVFANDGVEALLKLNNECNYIPDFIFLDVNMPKMNGIDCLKELKKIDRLENTMIFMYSTTSDERVVNESMKLGAHDFWVKPTKIGGLKEKLRNIFLSE